MVDLLVDLFVWYQMGRIYIHVQFLVQILGEIVEYPSFIHEKWMFRHWSKVRIYVNVIVIIFTALNITYSSVSPLVFILRNVRIYSSVYGYVMLRYKNGYR